MSFSESNNNNSNKIKNQTRDLPNAKSIAQFDVDFFQAVIDTLPDGAFVATQGCFERVNQALCQLLELSEAQILGQPIEQYIITTDHLLSFDERTHQAAITRLKDKSLMSLSPQQHISENGISQDNRLSTERSKAVPLPVPAELVTNTNRRVPIEYCASHMVDGANRVYQVVSVKPARIEGTLGIALKESEKKFRQLADNLPGIFLQTDAAGLITQASEYTCQLLGYQNVDLLGKRLSDLFTNLGEQADVLADVIDGKGHSVKAQPFFQCANGSSLKLSVSAHARYSAFGELLGIEVISDKDQQPVSENADEELTIIIDPLTRLPNKLSFKEYLTFAIKSARRNQKNLWLLYINIHALEQIERDLGQKTRERCLLHFSQRLQSFFRDTDIIARVSGDSFAVLLDDQTGDLPIQDLTERLNEEMARSTSIENHEQGFRFNLGHAKFPNNGFSSERLLEYAESVMYKNQFFKPARKIT